MMSATGIDTPVFATTPFTPAEAAVPRFKIHTRTVLFMDQQPIHMQVTAMDRSAWIWVSSGGLAQGAQQQLENAQSGSGSSGGVGGFGDLAMAMPALRAGQTAVCSTLLGNPIDETAANMARRLATRFKRQFLVNVDMPVSADNAMLLAFSERKLVDFLESIFAAEGN